VATVPRGVTDPDPPTDPDGDAGVEAGDSRGSRRGAGVARDPDDTNGDDRAEPRLANAPDDGHRGGDADGGAGRTDGSVADPDGLREPDPIEPETLRPENVLFVLLGVLGTVALLATAVVPGAL